MWVVGFAVGFAHVAVVAGDTAALADIAVVASTVDSTLNMVQSLQTLRGVLYRLRRLCF